MAPDKLIEQRHRPRPAGRAGFHLVGEAGHGEAVVGQLFQIAQFLHMAVRNLAPGLVPLPNYGRIARLQPALARVLTRTMSNGCSSCPIRFSSASTSATVTTWPSGTLRKSSLTPGRKNQSSGTWSIVIIGLPSIERD